MILKGQNFRILTFDSTASKFKCVGMATNCTVTLTNNTDDASTKDDVWECGSDIVNVGVEFAASSPNEVKRLRKLIRKAVDTYVKSNETDILSLRAINYDGIQWFWEKPCYYDTLHYQCDMVNDLNENEDEQED